MLFYYLKFKWSRESTNPRVVKRKSRQIMVSPNCAVCGSKISRFIEGQVASWLLISLVIRTPSI